MTKLLTFLIALPFITTLGYAQNHENLKMLFDKPSEYWEEVLRIGKGSIGAIDFDSSQKEQIQINEATFWAGSPSDK